MRSIQPKTKQNILMIIEVLQKYKQLHIRGMCRVIEVEYSRVLNPYTINRIIEEYLPDYIQINDLTESIGVRLKFCSLKPEYVNMGREEIVKTVIKKALDKHELRKAIRR